MENFNAYKALLKVYFINVITGSAFQKKNKLTKGEKKTAKDIIGKIGIVIVLVFALFSFLMSVYSFSVMATEGGYAREFLYCLVGVGQMLILFLGGTTTITNLYFAKDSELLLSLPFTSYQIFSAKLTASYVAQLIFSVIAVPFFITYGIAVQSCGITLDAWFYILSVLSFLFIPAVPMFLFTVLSAPLLFLSTFFKKKEQLKNIISLCLSVIFVAVYLVFFLGMENSSSPEGTRSLIEKMGNIFIFNYSLCESMLGNGATGNFFIYLAETIGLLAVSVLFCGFLYKKTIPKFGETTSWVKSKKKKDTVEEYIVKPVKKTLFAKDMKLLFGNPSLLVSCIVSVVMIGIFSAVSGKMFSDVSEDPYGLGLVRLGFVSYLIYIMLSASAGSTAFLFSLERNNIETIKSLPIAGKEVVLSKLKVSAVFPVVTMFVFAVCFSATVQYNWAYEIAFGLLSAVAFVFFGIGINAVMMKKDLQSPNFNFNTVNELTKNNKKMIKPMLSVMPIGIGTMIIDMVFGINGGNWIWWGYVIHIVILSLSAGLFFGIGCKKLINNAETLYENTEI